MYGMYGLLAVYMEPAERYIHSSHKPSLSAALFSSDANDNTTDTQLRTKYKHLKTLSNGTCVSQKKTFNIDDIDDIDQKFR